MSITVEYYKYNAVSLKMMLYRGPIISISHAVCGLWELLSQTSWGHLSSPMHSVLLLNYCFHPQEPTRAGQLGLWPNTHRFRRCYLAAGNRPADSLVFDAGRVQLCTIKTPQGEGKTNSHGQKRNMDVAQSGPGIPLHFSIFTSDMPISHDISLTNRGAEPCASVLSVISLPTSMAGDNGSCTSKHPGSEGSLSVVKDLFSIYWGCCWEFKCGHIFLHVKKEDNPLPFQAAPLGSPQVEEKQPLPFGPFWW